MSIFKRLFSRNRRYKRLKRETEASRLVAILNEERFATFIDVGANTGQTWDLLRKFGYRGRIISIEPLSDCHDLLLHKCQSDPNWVIAPRCALGDHEGVVEILVAEGSSLSSVREPTSTMADALPKAREAAREKVPLHRLDGLLKKEIEEPGRVFLKVDAQGHDMDILKGAEGVLDHIDGVKVEMSLLPLYEGETLYLDILKYLDDRGFKPWLLADVGYSKKHKRQLQIDGTFVRETMGSR